MSSNATLALQEASRRLNYLQLSVRLFLFGLRVGLSRGNVLWELKVKWTERLAGPKQ